jgi:hypothetical protein
MTPSIEADIDRLLAEHPPEIQAIERALRHLIKTEIPTVEEQVDFGNKLIAFGWSMKMRDLLFAIIAHKSHVNLQLADGAELPDPTGIVEGTGKRIRHVKLRSVQDVGRADVRALISAEIVRRREG